MINLSSRPPSGADPQHQNVNPEEVAKFNEMASQWWDPEGPCKPLHELNPIRLGYIASKVDLENKKVLDVGCGGGILTESLAILGADVIGIDMAQNAIDVAKLHAKTWENNDKIFTLPKYFCDSAEAFAEKAQQNQLQFDVITCMELLEHVPSPSSLVYSIAKMLKPGGTAFFSTLNRTPKSYLYAIVGAEYVLKLLPKGTHDYRHFIRPHELAALLRAASLQLNDLTGMQYSLFSKKFSLSTDLSTNYLAMAKKDD